MESTSSVQQLRRSAKLRNKVWQVVVAGLVLVAILAGLSTLNPIIGVLGSLLVLLMAILIPRPILIAYGLTLALPLTGGLARGAVIPVLRVGQALLVLGFIFFVLARPGRLGKYRLTMIDLIFAIFVLTEAVFPVLALYYNGDQINLFAYNDVLGQSPLQVLLGPIQYYVLYRIIVATISSDRQIKKILELSFIVSIIVSVIGILEKLVGPVRAFIVANYPPISQSATVSDTELRIASTLQHFSGLGAYLTFTLILALTCYTVQGQMKISRPLLAATFLFDSIALVLTGTIAAWIGLAVGVAAVFFLIRRIPKTVIFVLIGIILAVMIFQPFIADRLNFQFGSGNSQGLIPESLAFRIMLWKQIFLPAIAQNLLFGAGPAPTALISWPAEESQYFFVLLRGGLPYFLSYLLLLGSVIAVCWRQIKSKNDDASRPVAIALIAIIISISVMNLSGEYFTYVGGTQTIWTLLAIVVASWQLKKLALSDTFRIPAERRNRVNRQNRANNLLVNARRIAAATTLHEHNMENFLTKDAYWSGSYRFMSSYVAQEMSTPALFHHRLTWFKRLLDWQFVKDSVIVGLGSTISRVLGLLFSTILAHFLIPDDFGYVRYAITLAGILTIAASNSPVSLARFLAANLNDENARDRYFTNGVVGFALVLLTSLLISVPVLGLMHALDIGTISCIIGLAGFYCYLAIVRGLNSAWKMGLTYVLNNVVLVVVLVVVFEFFKIRSTAAALVIYGLSNLAPLALEMFRPMTLRFHFNLISHKTLLELTRFAIPIVISSGAFAIWFGVDLLLVQNFSPHESGSYAAAKTLAQVYIFVPTAITMVLMPRVAALDLEKSKRYVVSGALIALLISLFGFAIIYIAGLRIIAIAFGYRYIDAYVPLVVLSIGMCILSVYMVIEGFVIGHGRPKLTAQALLVAMTSTLVSSFWLVSRLGAIGASLAFTIGAASGLIVMLYNTWLFLHEKKHINAKKQSGSTPVVDFSDKQQKTNSEEPSEMKSVFIVWYSYSQRAKTLAAEIGGQVIYQYEAGLKRLWLTPLRYLIQGWKTWQFLERERPEIVLVQTPPIFAAMTVALWCRLRGKTRNSERGARYVIDAHTATFHHHNWRWALPLVRFLTQRAVVTLVTDEEALDMLRDWNAKGLFLIDGLPNLYPPSGLIGSDGANRVAVISVFSDDEPIEEVFDAARLLPEVTFYLTGNPERAPSQLLAQKPDNVVLTGFIRDGTYSALLKNVHGLVVLTKQPNDLSCAAYEGLAMAKPIVSSNGQEMQRFFTRGVIFVNNTPESISDGIKQMLHEQATLTTEVIAMRSVLEAKRQPKLEEFISLLQ